MSLLSCSLCDLKRNTVEHSTPEVVCDASGVSEAQHSHGSVKAATAGVDEASDHGVEDEGQDLQRQKQEEEGEKSALRSRSSF